MGYTDFIKRNWVVLLCFFTLIFIIYGQSLVGDFVYDDRGIVEHRDMLQEVSSLDQVVMHPYWNEEAGLYRPITLLSYSFNYIIFGDGPLSFHFINLVLYVFICFFIYLLTKKLFGQELLAFIAGLLFLVLPIHTEVVANITGRSELLCLFFSLLALLEFSRERINYLLLGLWIFLSVGSKETGIAILPILGILLYQKESKINLVLIKKYAREIASMIIAVSFYFFLRFFSLGINKFLDIKTSLIENQLLFTDPLSRMATALKILWMYFYKTFFPINLCSDYSYNQIPTIHNWLNEGTILGLLIIIIPVFLLFKYRNNKNPIFLGSGIFLFSFLPVSNLFFPIGTIAGERLFFFASLGLCMMVALATYSILISIKKENIKTVFLICLVISALVYGALSGRRQRVWVTEEALFVSGGKCAPNSVLSRSNLGAIYLIKGDLDKAEDELEISMNIKPIYSKGINNLGLVYFRKGERGKAREMYLKALSQDFPYSGAIENLILLYLSEGNTNMAKHWLSLLYPGDEKSVDIIIKNYLQKSNK